MMTAGDSAMAAAGGAGAVSERRFFLGFVLVAWLGVILGFAPPSWGRFNGEADYPAPLVLQVHAGLFLAWMVLLAVQVGLIRTGRRDLHRKMGLAMVAAIPPMVVTGFLAEAYSQRHYLANPPDSQAFFIVPIFYITAFGVLATWAVVKRRDAAAHKRLMYLATTIIVGAAWTRFIGLPLTALVGDHFLGMIANTFTSTNLFLTALALFDWRTRGRLHPVTAVGVPAIIACEFAVSWIYHAPGWLPIAYRLAQAGA